MPTGRLRRGYARIAGVARVEVLEELLRFREERSLPTRSQALCEALQEWYLARLSGLLTPRTGPETSPKAGMPERVLNPVAVDAKPVHPEGAPGSNGSSSA